MSGAWRIRIGAVLLLLATAGVLFLFGPASFADRFSGRVDADGTVQWGLSVDSVAGDVPIVDGEYGAWKVDYEIAGSMHTGMILGSYYEGQRIVVSAPGDGSFYSILREGTPTSVKVLGWLVAPVTLAATVLGTWWLVLGVRERDAQNREEARRQLARLYPNLFRSTAFAGGEPVASGATPIEPMSGPMPQQQPPTRLTSPPPPAGPEQPTDPKKPDFFAPYDI